MKTILAILCLGLASCGFRSIPANPAVTGHAAGVIPSFNASGQVMGFAAAVRAVEDREAAQSRAFYAR
jgi:hypothetical protein